MKSAKYPFDLSMTSYEKTRVPQSGGKITTKRQRRHNTTPYDRPPPPTSLQPPQKCFNWISDVIFPTTRMIASGAAKIFTFVFDSDDSSSSLSSSDSTHGSENDMNNDNYYETCNGFSSLNEYPGINEDDPQRSSLRSDANHVEKLLLTGKFSREECDKFIQIINSRVSIATNEHGRDLGSDMDEYHMFVKPVMESRKWLEEKKVEYSPMSYYTSDGSNYISRKQIDNEVGSPTDVAESYMKSRPPWASPSAEHVILNSPLILRSPVIREKIVSSAGDESSSLFKKRSRLVSGSWNIQKEIRRVRSKATQDLLHSNNTTLDPLMISNVGGNQTLKAIPGSKKTASELTSSNTGLGDDLRLIHHKHSSENANNCSTLLSAEVGGIIEEIQSQLIEKKGDENTHVENKCVFFSEASVQVPDVQEIGSFDNFSDGFGLTLPETYSGKAEGMFPVKQEGKMMGKYSRRNKGKRVNNEHDVAV